MHNKIKVFSDQIDVFEDLICILNFHLIYFPSSTEKLMVSFINFKEINDLKIMRNNF